MNKASIPDWTKGLPASTKVYSDEIMEFFGYDNSKKASVRQYIKEGLLPEPFVSPKLLGGSGCKRARKLFWLLGDLRGKS